MKTRLITLIVSVAILIGTIVGLPGPAWAHAMMANYALTDQFEINAVFSGGTPYSNARVVIYAPSDPSTPWLEGTTDANGHFAFSPDTKLPGDWIVRIGEGDHGDILTVPVDTEGVVLRNISRLPQQRVPGQLIVMGAIAFSYATFRAFKRWMRPKAKMM